jgi:hypothetical protein
VSVFPGCSSNIPPGCGRWSVRIDGISGRWAWSSRLIKGAKL